MENKKKNRLYIIAVLAICILSIAGIIGANIYSNYAKKDSNKYLIEITFPELEEKIANKETFFFVITQTTCGHCEEYLPNLKSVLRKHKVTGYELVLDKMKTSEIAKLKDIASTRGTPMTIFIENGKEKNTSTRLEGSRPPHEIEDRLRKQHYIE